MLSHFYISHSLRKYLMKWKMTSSALELQQLKTGTIIAEYFDLSFIIYCPALAAFLGSYPS